MSDYGSPFFSMNEKHTFIRMIHAYIRKMKYDKKISFEIDDKDVDEYDMTKEATKYISYIVKDYFDNFTDSYKICSDIIDITDSTVSNYIIYMANFDNELLFDLMPTADDIVSESLGKNNIDYYTAMRMFLSTMTGFVNCVFHRDLSDISLDIEEVLSRINELKAKYVDEGNKRLHDIWNEFWDDFNVKRNPAFQFAVSRVALKVFKDECD